MPSLDRGRKSASAARTLDLLLDFRQGRRGGKENDWNQGGHDRGADCQNVQDPMQTRIFRLKEESNDRERQQNTDGNAFAYNESSHLFASA